MKIKYAISSGAAVLLALLVTGCETDGGATARIQEKSAVYATLKQPEKDSIAQGNVMPGFTSDMVYMAVGSPTKVEPEKLPDGRDAEIWTYNNYYPPVDPNHKGSPAHDSGSAGDSACALEPALKAFTLRIEFQDGKVAQLALKHD